ncbi:DUF2723 domain-containing protein [Fibrobacterota bacterium]
MPEEKKVIAERKKPVTTGLDTMETVLQKSGARTVTALIMFGISLITYLLTVAPTVSFWDCGEFIACANIMGIPHPPGTPFFMLMGRTFILLFGFFEDVAFRMNMLSVLGSALGVMFIFLFTEKLLALIFNIRKSTFITFVGGLVAALLVNFSDTYWFNAVEAEVYGVSMFLVALISWLSLLWVENRDNIKGERMLLMICYLAFLGIGFHLYSVMTIPSIFVLMLFIDPKTRTNFPLIITGIGVMSVVYMVGSFITITVVIMALWLVAYMAVNDYGLKRRLYLCTWFCLVALIGYSTHAYIPIRSALNPD